MGKNHASQYANFGSLQDNRIFDRGTIVIIVNVVNAASYPTTVWTKAIAVMA